METKASVGIIRDENDCLEMVAQRSASDFVYENELGDIVVYSFFQDFEGIPSTREHFESMLDAITEKLLPKGLPVKGYIHTKDNIVVLHEDESTASIVDWPGAGDIKKITVSVATEDPEEHNEE